MTSNFKMQKLEVTSDPISVHRRILRLAIPNIVSNLAVPMLGAVDTAMMGHMEAAYYLGAIAVGGMIFSFIYWGFGFLRMGTTGLTAQAWGRRDEAGTALILARAMIIAAGCAVAVIALQHPIAALAFHLVNASPEVELYARRYFFIRIWAAPATLSLYAFHGWFLGMQNAKYPMLLAISVNALNIAFNIALVFGLGMRSDGVALGTVLAEYCGLALAAGLFLRRYGGASRAMRAARGRLGDLGAIAHMLAVNRDIFIRTLCLIFTFSFFTAVSAGAGDTVLAANTILMQLIGLMAYAVDGFAFAAESLVGEAVGMGDRGRLRETIRASFAWGLGFGILFAMAFAIGRGGLLRVFTNQDPVIALALVYMPWVIIGPIINVFCYIWDGVFIGATATAAMRNSMLICTLIIFLPAYYALEPLLGNHGLWLAFTLFMIGRGTTLTLMARRTIWGQT